MRYRVRGAGPSEARQTARSGSFKRPGRVSRSGAPLRVLFQRDTVLSEPTEGMGRDLLQVVSLNFPRAASLAEGNENSLAEWLEDRLVLVADAHEAKKMLLDRLGKKESPAGATKSGSPADRGIFGVGLWGLEEMTWIHLGRFPQDDDEALRWLLRIVARLKLRMTEIGRRRGLELKLVPGLGDELDDRFIESLAAAGFEGGGSLQERPSRTGWNGRKEMVRKGKVHPLLASGQTVLEVEYDVGRKVDEVEDLLRYLASSTHVSGLSLSGKWVRCGKCGSRFQQRRPVCESCGGRIFHEVERRNQGKLNRVVRL